MWDYPYCKLTSPVDVPPAGLPQQYISPEHARVSGGNNSQGPVYKVYVSCMHRISSHLA